MDPIIVALISGAVSIIASLITYLTQRPKMRADSRNVAEQADELVFQRLQIELVRRDERIDELEKRLEQEIIQRKTAEKKEAEMGLALEAERELRHQMAVKLEAEREKRRELEMTVARQGKEIAELQSENQTLHNQYQALARRLDTGALSKGGEG